MGPMGGRHLDPAVHEACAAFAGERAAAGGGPRVWRAGGRHDQRAPRSGSAPPGTAAGRQRHAAAEAPPVARLGGDTLRSHRAPEAVTVRRLLNDELRQAQEEAACSGIFLELFAGTGVLGRHLQKVARCPRISFDLAQGAQYDLTAAVVMEVVLSWLRRGLVQGVWLAPPCATWSVARYPALRSRTHLLGKPEAMGDSSNRQAVMLGNATMRAAQRVAEECLRLGISCIIENPRSSHAWALRRWRLLAGKRDVQCVVTDFCAYGTPWRKRTQLMCIHVDNAATLGNLCCGRHGLCSFSGRPHVQLRGGQRTRVAEQYPARLCRLAATILAQAAERRNLALLFQLSGGRH